MSENREDTDADVGVDVDVDPTPPGGIGVEHDDPFAIDAEADLEPAHVPGGSGAGPADRHQQVLGLEAERIGQALAAEPVAPGGVERTGGVAVLDREPHVVAVPAETHPGRPVRLASDQLWLAGWFDQCHRGAEAAELPIGRRRPGEPEERSVG